MPELPEVETIRRELERDVAGRKIKSVDVRSTKPLKRHSTKKQFTSQLDDAKVKTVTRRGKYLLFWLDNGHVLVVHLGMSGRLLRTQNKDDVEKHTHVVVQFTQGGQLRFVDPRTFGEMFVVPGDELEQQVDELAGLGLDPVEEPISWTTFGELLLSRSVKLKSLLTDQSIIAGIGNIYSDEILFEAGLRYDRQSDSLTAQEIRRLYRSVVEVLHEAVKHRGTTLEDGGYVDLHGKAGEYQDHLRVYGRAGEPCPRCRTQITKARWANRSTYFCEQCQI